MLEKSEKNPEKELQNHLSIMLSKV